MTYLKNHCSLDTSFDRRHRSSASIEGLLQRFLIADIALGSSNLDSSFD